MSSTNIMDMDLSELTEADFNLSMEELVSGHTTQEQSVVNGTVLRIDEEHVLIDINYKAEGFVDIGEFMVDGELAVAVGDSVEVFRAC